jgi:GH18 family chitinase
MIDCAPENCVANCDSKTYCDPGFSEPGYAEVSRCPLDVCCSKFGFCGLTEEFCGDKKVAKPSSNKNHQLERVVGYYEGWATDRPCHAYYPEDIPLGVYTHINFAFASIDPVTYTIVPSLPNDPGLYRRLTNLKRSDLDLKVYIAIGGWTFNDAGPTATTFSELAASEAKQQKFFQSLAVFMANYGFDGVDFDWEYPGAEDRSGSA